MSDVTFRLAQAADAGRLSVVAREIFLATFGPDNDPADLRAYLDSAFTTAVQEQEIEQPDAFSILAEDASGGIVGYAFVASGAPSSVAVEPEPIEIKRFYLTHEYHGRGLATALMQEVFDHARRLGARTIWLGVWERNERAIAFYHKLGFTQAGTQAFLLGSDLQTDWVMQNTSALR